VSGAGQNDPSQRRRAAMTNSTDRVSRSPASLSRARAFIDTLREEIGSLGVQELIEALARLTHAYQEFPELELDWPRSDLSEELRSAVKRMPDQEIIPLLTDLVGFDPTCLSSMTLLAEKIVEADNWQSLSLVLGSLDPSIRFGWHVIEPVITALCQSRSEDIKFPLLARLLQRTEINDEDTGTDFGDVLAHLLSDQHAAGIDRGALAKAAQSARRPPSQPALSGEKLGSRDALLAIAQRLRAPPSPQRPNPHPDLFWPSGRMSFDEFLMQWPCEVELPVELDDKEFIEVAYQAVLLREPNIAEMGQYLTLLQNGIVSKPWIIEDLLGLEEFRSFERRLRVIWGGGVITEPGRPEAAEMPAVAWPWRSAT